jgi:hypothetical protein
MRLRTTLLAVAALALAGAADAQTTRVPLDHEVVIAGVPVGCTGIGQTKNDPKWQAYNVRVEFADTARGLLADETLTLSDGDAPVLSVKCEGPWILLKLPVGHAFGVSGTVPHGGGPQTATVKAPSHGQGVFVLTFPIAQ